MGEVDSYKYTADDIKVMNKCIEAEQGIAAFGQEKADASKSFNIKCDTKDMSFTQFKKEACKGDTAKESSVEWGKCLSTPGDKMWVKVSGAQAIQAASAAALAFAATQF